MDTDNKSNYLNQILHVDKIFTIFLDLIGGLWQLRCIQTSLDYPRSSIDEIRVGSTGQSCKLESINSDQFDVPSRNNESKASLRGVECALIVNYPESIIG